MLDKSALYAQKPDEQEQRIARQQLQQVVAYCESDICRRRVLLAYFGETLQGENCGNCDNCLSSTPLEDRTSDAQKFLLCIARTQDTHDKSGCYGMRHIIDILRGANTQKIRDYGHDQLPTYGIGKDLSADEWLRLGRALLHQGLLSETTDGYPVLRLNALSREILRKQRNVQIESHDPESQKRLALIRTSAKRLVIIKPNLLPLKPEEEAVIVNVLQHLRNLRKRIADEQGVPPYVVFADVSLRAMAQQRPQRRSLFAVFKKAPPGVGSRKLEAYFTIFTDEIRAYCELHNLSIDLEPPSEQLEQKRTYVPAVNVNTPTRQLTLQLHRQGLSIEEIARERNLKPTTVAGYLAELIEAGEAVTVERLIRPERYTVIADALQQVGGDTHDKSGCYGLLRTFWEMRAQAS